MSSQEKIDRVKLDKQRAFEIIDRFKKVPLAVLGDLILDHYIWGQVSRISPEAPVVVVNVVDENRTPGGAGNVAKNILALGGQVHVCAVVGDDEDGRILCQLLKEQGADCSGVIIDKTRRTTVKTRVIAHSQQVVRVDREQTHALDDADTARLNDLFFATLQKSRGVVISDYAKGTVTSGIFDRLAASPGKMPPIVLDPKDAHFPMYRGTSFVKPNRSEASAASGIVIRDRASAVEAAKILLDRWQSRGILITLGEMGMVLVERDEKAAIRSAEIETTALEVYDVSGAGDTVSAVFTLALAAGAAAVDAAMLANLAAGVVVAEVGTVAITDQQLREAVIQHAEE